VLVRASSLGEDDVDPDILAMIAASSALSVSTASRDRWRGGVDIRRHTAQSIDRNWPQFAQLVSRQPNAVLMVEAGAIELSEDACRRDRIRACAIKRSWPCRRTRPESAAEERSVRIHLSHPSSTSSSGHLDAANEPR